MLSCRGRDRLSRAHPRRSAARRTSSGRGGACPSRSCQVGRAVQCVGPAPTSPGALSGRYASAGYGPVIDASAFAQSLEGRMKAWWPPRDTTSR